MTILLLKSVRPLCNGAAACYASCTRHSQPAANLHRAAPARLSVLPDSRILKDQHRPSATSADVKSTTADWDWGLAQGEVQSILWRSTAACQARNNSNGGSLGKTLALAAAALTPRIHLHGQSRRWTFLASRRHLLGHGRGSARHEGTGAASVHNHKMVPAPRLTAALSSAFRSTSCAVLAVLAVLLHLTTAPTAANCAPEPCADRRPPAVTPFTPTRPAPRCSPPDADDLSV
jgi:hypothetical protein